MPEEVYVNGRFVSRQYALQHVEDRGNQFGDAVYEVIQVYQRRLIDEKGHLTRLAFSLQEMGIDFYMSPQILGLLIRDLLSRNRISNGQIYLQISRGVITRRHTIPIPQPKAGFYMVTRYIDFDAQASMQEGIAMMSIPDTRWARPDIKTVGLLPNVLAKSFAIAQGYDDVLFTDDEGILREGSSNNFYAVIGNKLYEYPANGHILAGITRASVSALAPQCGLQIVKQGWATAKLAEIDEAFITSAGVFVTPVINVDGKKIGNGKIGAYTKKLQATYYDYMMSFPEEII